MMERVSRWIATAVVLAGMLGVTGVASAQQPVGPDSAQGSGVGPDCIDGGATSSEICETFEFTAQSGPDGENASGTLSYQPPNRTASFAGAVICLTVLGDG